jgi:hypothetical protein
MEQILGSSSDDRLKRPVRGGVSVTTEQRSAVDHSAQIAGWGSDLDLDRRPGVPRDKAPEIGGELLYPLITQQQPTHRIHKSTEHGKLTPVFGTSCPPRGLSGRIRDIAYRFSEGPPWRWMMLMFADRVDMVESAARDIAELNPPNLVREMGLRSEWKYNKQRVVKVAAITTVALSLYLIARNRRRRA